jgi:FMN-dependent NADH-azoreductase
VTQLLHIDASPRGARSHSRTLTGEFVARWADANPGATVVHRDLERTRLPFVDEPWIAAAYSAPGDRTPEQRAAIRISDDLVDEFLAADVIVLGTPMYNFGVPAVLKAYVDQIVRVGRTFSADYQGLAHGKKLYVITVRGGGGYGPGQAMHGMDYEDPYLRAIFGFIGVTDVTFVDVENAAQGDEVVRASLATAREQIAVAVAAAA